MQSCILQARPSLARIALLSCPPTTRKKRDAGSRGRCRPCRQGRADLRRRRCRRRHRQRTGGGDPAGARGRQGAGGRPRSQACRTHGRDDRGRRRHGGGCGLRRHRGGRLQSAGRSHRRPLRPARLPRQQCRHRQPRQRGRREGRGIPAGDADQCREHVPALEIRDSRDDQDRQRRRHRQHLLDLGAAAARAHHLHDLEGRGDRADAGDGGRSRPRQHPRQLHLSGADVHADGLCPRHERGRPRPARQGFGAEDWKAPAGTSATPSNSCSAIMPATSPARCWWSMAASRLQAPERESQDH